MTERFPPINLEKSLTLQKHSPISIGVGTDNTFKNFNVGSKFFATIISHRANNTYLVNSALGKFVIQSKFSLSVAQKVEFQLVSKTDQIQLLITSTDTKISGPLAKAYIGEKAFNFKNLNLERIIVSFER